MHTSIYPPRVECILVILTEDREYTQGSFLSNRALADARVSSDMLLTPSFMRLLKDFQSLEYNSSYILHSQAHNSQNG